MRAAFCITVGIVRCAAGDADIRAGEGKDEQSDQRVVLNWRTGERFMQSVGAQVV
jgi:hypothetical protein